MKKTISINISGVIFNIEEDAYEDLRKYLDTISGYFTDSDGKDEIMLDIESRIAELFQLRLNDQKHVVNTRDVGEVIDIMGRPEEYIDEEATSEPRTRHTAHAGKRRRIYRDVDKNVVGGVSAGIAHHFGWDPLWIRLAWAASVLTVGIGVLPYIILWIILPAADTTAEKLEMMGEPVNVDNIKKKVSATYEDLKAKAGGSIDSDFQMNYAKGQVAKGSDFVVDILKRFFRFIGRFLGFVFLLAGLIVITAIVYSFIDDSMWQFNHVSVDWGFSDLQRALFNSNGHSYMFLSGALLVSIIPVIGLILLGARLLFKTNTNARTTFPVLFTFWIVGLVTLVISGIGLGKEFVNTESSSAVTSIKTVGEVLYLDVNENRLFSNSSRFSDRRFPQEMIELADDSIYFGFPELRIVQNIGSDLLELEVERRSSGFTSELAYERADKISYDFNQSGDTLNLDSYYSCKVDDKFRGQSLMLTLWVPKGRQVYFGEKLPRILDEADNRNHLRIRNMVRKYWVMTDEGLRAREDILEEIGDNETNL